MALMWSFQLLIFMLRRFLFQNVIPKDNFVKYFIFDIFLSVFHRLLFGRVLVDVIIY